MDKTKKIYDDYMTLEASFIMPLAVFLIAALMYLSFYLYTVSFLNQAAYVSAFRGSLCEPDSGRMKATAESELDKLLEERVLPVRNLEKQVRASPLGVNVSLRAELSLPFPGVRLFTGAGWEIKAEKKALSRDAVAFIRLARKAGNL